MAKGLPDPRWTESAPECVACGYSLHGLPAPGRCPECGAEYDDKQLVLAGIPNRSRGGSKPRLVLWIIVAGGAAVYANIWGILLEGGVPWQVTLAIGGAFIVAASLMLATNRRERSGTERFVITPSGIWRIPPVADPTAVAQGSFLVRWEGANSVKMKRHSPVWRRIVIRRESPTGRNYRVEQVVFDAGIRCPDAMEGEVLAAVEQCMWRAARRAEAGAPPPPGSPRGDGRGAPPPPTGSPPGTTPGT